MHKNEFQFNDTPTKKSKQKIQQETAVSFRFE